MKSLWNDKEARRFSGDPLALRVYTSRLLGRDTSLVMHGGGNTSVKTEIRDFFGTIQQVLYIKGSGWDLSTIEAEGFAAVKIDTLLRLAAIKQLTDAEMVRQQRAAMIDPNAPTPSVEAILHAIIPYNYVDHSHADALVTITNTPDGKKRIESIYGKRVLVVPYVMPGFILARKIYEMTLRVDWSQYEGIVLLNHGLFTFADSAKESYENHIKLVSEAEEYIRRIIRKASLNVIAKRVFKQRSNLLDLARLRQAVSRVQGRAVVALLKKDDQSIAFSQLRNIKDCATRGTLTPDHVIRTKPKPVLIIKNIDNDVNAYAKAYKAYFDRHTDGKLKCLDLAPRWAVWPDYGVVAFGRSLGEAQIISDIADHTIQAIQRAEGMGGWKVLNEKDLFDVEYWELEQAKLAKGPKPLGLQGKIALVTGAASGIGKACARQLMAQGAHVIGLDINKSVMASKEERSNNYLGIHCDVTKGSDIKDAVGSAVRRFGGLDIIVSNAGLFPPSMDLVSMDAAVWEKSMKVNLTSHQLLVKEAVPYLSHGIDPTIIIIASKNVPAPGPGAGAYSVAKAGLTQLGRVAALELGSKGIRVNMIHPNQVFDTAIWTKDVLEKRARQYGLSVAQYATDNVLRTTITSKDVAELVCAMAGSAFAKTTGAQIPIDGGNERVI
jgi:rhamnose utilization protein RhaD (predicted bifunctional aldolase and dehydrogenase)/NAD(P)-dependent dehydrogenase (short-subunit alcohol dehydrogenase family)